MALVDLSGFVEKVNGVIDAALDRASAEAYVALADKQGQVVNLDLARQVRDAILKLRSKEC